MTLRETLTKQLYCSKSEEAIVFLLWDNASLKHTVSLICSITFKLWSGAYQTRSNTRSFA